MVQQHGQQHRVQDGLSYVVVGLRLGETGASIELTTGIGGRAESAVLSPRSAATLTRHLIDMLASVDPAGAMRLVDELVVATHTTAVTSPGSGSGPC